MSILMEPHPTAEDRLRAGDPDAAGELFTIYRDRLKRMVQLRMDDRLRGRLDASDILQDAFIDVQRKAPEFAQRKLPVFLWLRLVVAERLLQMRRYHIGTRMRDVSLEVSLAPGGWPAASTHSLANHLLGRHTSPTQAAIRAERQRRLQDALNRMDLIDREIIALRHFEELSNNEAAAVLELSKSAASNRYIRAIKRLKDILSALPNINPNSSL